MAQQNGNRNWIIHNVNASGEPHVIKLIPQGNSGSKTVGSVITSGVSTQPLKIIKTSQSSGEITQIINSNQQQTMVKNLGSKIITKTVPIQVNSVVKQGTKIRINQLPNVRLVNASHITNPNSNIGHSTNASFVQSPQNIKNISPPILQRKRADPMEMEYSVDSKRIRKSEKVGKGLRHFSMKVCEKVQKKGTTTYNEVADELVYEFTNPNSSISLADQQYDQKNIRRRVYDALNVLMAMNIISKEKKEIKWIGLPTNSLQKCVQLEKEKQQKLFNIREKRKQLQELVLNQIAFKNLAQRNKQMEEAHGPPPLNSSIHLPFIVVNTNKKTVIDCSISNNKLEYFFQFNDKFEITDDVDILKSIGMLMGLDSGECTPENLEIIKSMVPKSLEDYVVQLANGQAQSDVESMDDSGASSSMLLEDLVETTMDEENSRQSSSCDPLSPCGDEYSDEENESDLSSDIE